MVKENKLELISPAVKGIVSENWSSVYGIIFNCHIKSLNSSNFYFRKYFDYMLCHFRYATNSLDSSRICAGEKLAICIQSYQGLKNVIWVEE